MVKGLGVLGGFLIAAVGCSTLDRATEDHTSLAGEVPERLGRILEVELTGEGDEGIRAELLQAIRAEFESRDLFDHVVAAVHSGDVAGRRASRLEVLVEEHSEEELFDLMQFQGGYVVRFELQVNLKDSGGKLVLEGHVSGIGEDTVTESEVLDDAVRGDVRMTAMHDAGMKLSRGLRLTADARAREALDALERITLPPGVGPLDVAVLGFDEDSRRRRGAIMAGQVARALELLGPDLRLTPPEDILRAMNELPRSSFMDLGSRELKLIAERLPAKVFVLGELRFTGEELQVVGRVFDREGELLQEHAFEESGLGALRVLAARLAQATGSELVGKPPSLGDPTPGNESQ